MEDTATQSTPKSATTTVEDTLKTAGGSEINRQAQETDGFQLVIDALKLNGIDTIFGLPGIPITDLTRRMQAAGLRVISFRHEQNAGYAASIAGFMTGKPGICLTVSAPGFLNGLTALANATTNCFPMILISGSSEREIVDLAAGRLRGDGPARHRQGRTPRPRSGCCTPRTSASAWRVRSVPRFPAVRAASISICRRSCSRSRSTRKPGRSR